MFKHVRKCFPWHERTRRKKEFLDKLKGTTTVRIRKNAPVGSIFVVSNYDTGDINTFYNINTNKWRSFGSCESIVTTYSNRSLEMHLSKLIQESTKENAIHIIDESHCVERIKPK